MELVYNDCLEHLLQFNENSDQLFNVSVCLNTLIKGYDVTIYKVPRKVCFSDSQLKE